jgi:hypothetical protein
MTDNEIETLMAMERHGGGFASHLASAWLRADLANSARLEAVFGDLRRSFAVFVPHKLNENEEN